MKIINEENYRPEFVREVLRASKGPFIKYDPKKFWKRSKSKYTNKHGKKSKKEYIPISNRAVCR